MPDAPPPASLQPIFQQQDGEVANPYGEILRLLAQWTPDSDAAELAAALDRAGIRVADILPDIYVLNPDAALALRQWLE